MELSKNIFDYASSELSQDAFLCWVFAYLSDKNDNDVKSYARFLLKQAGLPKSVCRGEFNNLRVEQQVVCGAHGRADIVLSWQHDDNKFALVIEDKVNSGENRKDQLLGYVEEISSNYDFVYGIYVKTGFIFADEEQVIKGNLQKNDKFRLYALLRTKRDNPFLFDQEVNNPILRIWLDYIDGIHNREQKLWLSDLAQWQEEWYNDEVRKKNYLCLLERLKDFVKIKETEKISAWVDEHGTPQLELFRNDHLLMQTSINVISYGIYVGIYLFVKEKNVFCKIRTHFGKQDSKDKSYVYCTHKDIRDILAKYAGDERKLIQNVIDKWEELNQQYFGSHKRPFDINNTRSNLEVASRQFELSDKGIRDLKEYVKKQICKMKQFEKTE